MCEWSSVSWEEKTVTATKGMADGLVLVKEHEGIEQGYRRKAQFSLMERRSTLVQVWEKYPHSFLWEVCWLDRAGEGWANRELGDCLLVCSAGFPTSFLAVKFCHWWSSLLQVIRFVMGSKRSDLLTRRRLA